MFKIHQWFTLSDGGDSSVDFAVSENLSPSGKPMVAFQLYKEEDGGDMCGNIYIEEKEVDKLINDLLKVRLRMKRLEKSSNV